MFDAASEIRVVPAIGPAGGAGNRANPQFPEVASWIG